MFFNSIDFAIFLPIVFALYWGVFNRDLRLQNVFLLVVSYIFYGWWDERFLALIAFSSAVDFLIGREMGQEKAPRRRKLLLLISLFVNLGLLAFFKYTNFFLESFVDAFSLFGNTLDIQPLKIILPVGISFYTFQTLSYTIDIYRGKLKPTQDIITFFSFVSFFPQLVAGPIERAANLLPQFDLPRRFSYEAGRAGLQQILWGLFKKMVIADNCGYYANDIFANYQDYSGSTLLLGAIFFAFQIYGDFSGYSDIAIGVARLLGFKLMRNFAFPYFSRDIAEFWRRWHISLSTWFRDYLYIPLGGSKGSTAKKVRNTFAIFLISGFWHGANWTFIVWGALNALYFLPLLLLKRNRRNLEVVAYGTRLPSIREFFQIGITFLLTTLAWVFFRADNLTHAFDYLGGIMDVSLWSKSNVLPIDLLCWIGLMLVFEWWNRREQHGLDIKENALPMSIRWLIYLLLVFIIILFSGQQEAFIYFQF